ncbi:MAG: hypothetical protein JWQ50_394 [Caballeronia mineralivorans]|nr:hypothetical protein [Caballeronia mineralivorans]
MRQKNSQMANLADARGAFQDEIGGVLGKQGTECSRERFRPTATEPWRCSRRARSPDCARS